MYYTECLPLNCSTLLRKATLGCLPKKTFVQGTFVGPLASWNSYLHITCIARLGLKLKSCGIALLHDPIQRRKPGDARRSNLVSRRLQNNSESVTSPRPGQLASSAMQGNPDAKNSSQLHLTVEGNLTCCQAIAVWPS